MTTPGYAHRTRTSCMLPKKRGGNEPTSGEHGPSINHRASMGHPSITGRAWVIHQSQGEHGPSINHINVSHSKSRCMPYANQAIIQKLRQNNARHTNRCKTLNRNVASTCGKYTYILRYHGMQVKPTSTRVCVISHRRKQTTRIDECTEIMVAAKLQQFQA